MDEKLITKMLDSGIICQSEVVRIRYGIHVLNSEILKTAGLLFIFYGTGHIKAFLFLMLLIMPLRMFTGGIHLASSLTCFMFTLANYSLNILIFPMIEMNHRALLIILWNSIMVILLSPLAPSAKRPIKSREKYLLNKILSALLCLSWGYILSYVIKDGYLISCGIWAFSIQAIQIIICNLTRKGNNHV